MGPPRQRLRDVDPGAHVTAPRLTPSELAALAAYIPGRVTDMRLWNDLLPRAVAELRERRAEDDENAAARDALRRERDAVPVRDP